MKSVVPRTKIGVIIASAVLWAGMVAAHPADQAERIVVVTSLTPGADEQQAPVANGLATTQTQPIAPEPATPPEPPVAAVVATARSNRVLFQPGPEQCYHPNH
jgi:hypothetical protein